MAISKIDSKTACRVQKKFKSRYASLRPAAGLRPTLAFAALRSKKTAILTLLDCIFIPSILGDRPST